MTDEYTRMTSSTPPTPASASTSAAGGPGTTGLGTGTGAATGAGTTAGTTGSTGTSRTGSAPPLHDVGTGGTSGLSDTAQAASEKGGHLLDEARGEAKAVTHEARRQLSDLLSQARTEISDQASTQQTRLAGGMTSLGGQLVRMADGDTEQNMVSDAVRDLGERAERFGRWLEAHGPDEVMVEVRRFARRRPGTFLAIAAGAGVLAGRLTRGMRDASSSGGSGTSGAMSGGMSSGTPTRVSTGWETTGTSGRLREATTPAVGYPGVETPVDPVRAQRTLADDTGAGPDTAWNQP